MTSYDPANRATQLWSDAGALAFTHDAAGRERRRTIGESTLLAQEWDEADRLTVQHLSSAQDRTLQHRIYGYRADGYLSEMRELTSGTSRCTLDAIGRATSVRAVGWSETYAYDAAGNLTHGTSPGQGIVGQREFEGTLIRRADRTRYEYDGQGRLIAKIRQLLNGRKRKWTYSWTAQDQMTSAVTPEGEQWQYVYDPLGRRIAKYRVDKDGSNADQTEFSWDGTRLAEQTGPDGAVTTWDYAVGTHRPLTQTRHRPRGAKTSYLAELAEDTTTERVTHFHAIITGPVGTPAELVTADGQVEWQKRASLWGMPLPSPEDGPPMVDCPLRFPGQYANAETGQNYNYFRSYDPETARYISPDPMGLEPAGNHHGYLHAPHTWQDPLGLSPCNYGIEDLYSSAATVKKGQLSPAGRALQKHGDPSPGNIEKRGRPHVDLYDFGKVTNVERTQIANEMIEDILTDPRVVEKVNTSALPQYGGITRDFRVPGGWGARWSWRGGQLTFEGFLWWLDRSTTGCDTGRSISRRMGHCATYAS